MNSKKMAMMLASMRPPTTTRTVSHWNRPVVRNGTSKSLLEMQHRRNRNIPQQSMEDHSSLNQEYQTPTWKKSIQKVINDSSLWQQKWEQMYYFPNQAILQQHNKIQRKQ
jgi:hypothetical protein